jgi:predicted PurR-regulated permease PerM
LPHLNLKLFRILILDTLAKHINIIIMFQSKHQHWPIQLKLTIIGIILYTLWVFNSNFITPLILGLVLATLTFPIYEFYGRRVFNIFSKKRQGTFSAITTMIVVAGAFTIVLNIVANQLIKELPDFADSIIRFANELPNNQPVIDFLNNIGISRDYVTELLGNVDKQVEQFGKQVGADSPTASQLFTQSNINNAFNFSRQTLNIFFNQLVYLVVFLLSWFNCLINGKNWLNHIFHLLPFNREEIHNITTDFRDGVRNVIYANLLSGAIHAIACFFFMWIFGVPNMFILSIIIFFIGVLPLSPSELGYIIPILFVFSTNPLAAILFIILGECIILWVNYLLIPQMIASGEEGNNLLILTSILTGIAIFGLMGFIIGPLIIIFIQTLYRILIRRIEKEENKGLPSAV